MAPRKSGKGGLDNEALTKGRKKARGVAANNQPSGLEVAVAEPLQELDFSSPELKNLYSSFIARGLVLERGLQDESPYIEYIDKHECENFCATPVRMNKTLTCEMMSLLQYTNYEVVYCRSKRVVISAEVINEYYRIPQKPASEYAAADKAVDKASWGEILKMVCVDGETLMESFPSKWSTIDKKFLTNEMNVWYHFFAPRLKLVRINTEVHRSRLMLLYKIKKNMRIAVGSTIMAGIRESLHNNNIGFSSLLTGLCSDAGCELKSMDIPHNLMHQINPTIFDKRQRAVAPAPSGPKSGQIFKEKLESQLNALEAKMDHLIRWAEEAGKYLTVIAGKKMKYLEALPTFNMAPSPAKDDASEEDGIG